MISNGKKGERIIPWKNKNQMVEWLKNNKKIINERG